MKLNVSLVSSEQVKDNKWLIKIKLILPFLSKKNKEISIRFTCRCKNIDDGIHYLDHCFNVFFERMNAILEDIDIQHIIIKHLRSLSKKTFDVKNTKIRLDKIYGYIRDDHEALLNSVEIGRRNQRVREQHNAERDQKDAITVSVNKFDNYPSLFPIARSMKREFIFHAGPTNSGKTYGAMQELMQAETGMYLAPLRLMAMEAHDRMNAAGIITDMSTGEERFKYDGAKHIASTIEMMDMSKPVDVCIIDEVQMILDGDRGWAWTQAIVGCPAKKIIMTGSPEVRDYVKKLVSITGDDYKEIIFERLNALSLLNGMVDINTLRSGDAIIAFSRRQVLELHDELNHAGMSVACIYGALSPEVRRRESERFASGQADILVATDAIGMGLNLPIRRVLFSSLMKYNGKMMVSLTPSEIRQIGGRAGRYGLHNSGKVGLFKVDYEGDYLSNINAIRNALDFDIFSHRICLRTYPVMPTSDMVNYVSNEYDQTFRESMLTCSRLLNENCNDTVFRFNITSAQMEIIRMTEAAGSGLDSRIMYTYLGCPVKIKNASDSYFFMKWMQNHARDIPNEMPDIMISREDKLEDIESMSSLTTMYLWLNMRFPHFYPDHNDAVDIHRTSDNLIEWFMKDKLSAVRIKKEKDVQKHMERYKHFDNIFDMNNNDLTIFVSSIIKEKKLVPLLVSWIKNVDFNISKYHELRASMTPDVDGSLSKMDAEFRNFWKHVDHPKFSELENIKFRRNIF